MTSVRGIGEFPTTAASTADGVIGFEVVGEVHSDDYRDTLLPALEAAGEAGTIRLVYVLGAIFGVSDRVGGELLETSRDNFRQKLTRARRDLRSFMNDECGLVKTSNPCRCAKKTRGFIKAGYIDAGTLLRVGP